MVHYQDQFPWQAPPPSRPTAPHDSGPPPYGSGPPPYGGGAPPYGSGPNRNLPLPVVRESRDRAGIGRSPWHWLLWIPIIVPLVPTLYNRIEPQLLGLPFYYWGQLSFALLSTAVILVVHLATKER